MFTFWKNQSFLIHKTPKTATGTKRNTIETRTKMTGELNRLGKTNRFGFMTGSDVHKQITNQL